MNSAGRCIPMSKPVTIDTITTRLEEIETSQNVAILYACESGSRAWGFPSANSDYDVRFLYLRPVEWYLSIEDKRDVIEYSIDDRLDITGWDLRKALQLLRKSNPPLLEWLGSPIVYREKYSITGKMREVAKNHYSPLTYFHHYLNTALNHFHEARNGNEISIKEYFYTLRTILAVQWIEAGFGLVPTEFGILLERMVSAPILKDEIQNLMALKKTGTEADGISLIPAINEFIESELARLENKQPTYKNDVAPFETLDAIFRGALSEVWNDSPA